MTDEQEQLLSAMPTFATVDADGLDLEFCLGRLRLGWYMDVSADDRPDGSIGYYCVISIFDDVTSVATMTLSIKQFHQAVLLGYRDGHDAAYAYALSLYRAVTH